MLAYILRRLLLMVPTLIGVVTLTFVVTQFVPDLNQFPLANVLKEAIQAGVLQLPFQYQFVVTT